MSSTACQLLADMGLPADESILRSYPRQLSVGQAQRVAIAMADEPTSALDALSQMEILELFRRLNRELAMAILYVSHNLEPVLSLCQTAGVLREGRLVESGPVERVFAQPMEAFTRQLPASAGCRPWPCGSMLCESESRSPKSTRASDYADP